MKQFVTWLWKLIESIVRFFLIKVFRLKLSEEAFENFLQFIKFCMVGVTNTIIGYVIYVVVVFALRPCHVSWDYIAGNLMEYLLSVLWSFYLNEKFVFTLEEGQQRSKLRALLKSYATYGFTGIVLNNVFGYVWIRVFLLSKYIAPILSLIASVPINFLLSKLWAFRAKKKAESSALKEG